MQTTDFIMLDGTVNTLPKYTHKPTEKDFETYDIWGRDYGREFREISTDIPLVLLCADGKSHRGALSISFRYWLDTGEITKQPLFFNNQMEIEDDDCLIEYWYDNPYFPEMLSDDFLFDVEADCYTVVGWKYDE